jgi:hypothetical protein
MTDWRKTESYRSDKSKAQKALYRKRWAERNRHRQSANARLRTTGMPAELYEYLLAKQDGKCACCGNIPKRLAADHCHATGKLGLLLCDRCNVAISALESPLRPIWEAYLLANRSPGAYPKDIQDILDRATNKPTEGLDAYYVRRNRAVDKTPSVDLSPRRPREAAIKAAAARWGRASSTAPLLDLLALAPFGHRD